IPESGQGLLGTSQGHHGTSAAPRPDLACMLSAPSSRSPASGDAARCLHSLSVLATAHPRFGKSPPPRRPDGPAALQNGTLGTSLAWRGISRPRRCFASEFPQQTNGG